jgi:hypothetical protein
MMMKTKIVSVVALVSVTPSMTLVAGTFGVIVPIHNKATAQQIGDQEFDDGFRSYPHIW